MYMYACVYIYIYIYIYIYGGSRGAAGLWPIDLSAEISSALNSFSGGPSKAVIVRGARQVIKSPSREAGCNDRLEAVRQYDDSHGETTTSFWEEARGAHNNYLETPQTGMFTVAVCRKAFCWNCKRATVRVLSSEGH